MSVFGTLLQPGETLLLTRGSAAVRVRRSGSAAGSAAGSYRLLVDGLPRTLTPGGRGVVLDVGGVGVVLRLASGGRSGAAVPLRVEAPASVTILKTTARAAG